MIKTRLALAALALLMALPVAAQDATTEPTPDVVITVEPSPEATLDPGATTEPTAEPGATEEPGATTEPGTDATDAPVSTSEPAPAGTAEATATQATTGGFDMTERVIVSGLHAPRHIFLMGEDIYIAEAGTGGPTTIETDFGPLTVGGTGQITKVTDGVATPFITNLFSSASQSGEATGPHAFYLDANAAWVLIGQGIPGAELDLPTFALISFSPDGMTQGTVIDLYGNEVSTNPDGGEIDSNPVDFVVAPDGTVFVADAGANAVLRVGTDGVVSTFAVWTPVEGEPQPVPTSVELDAEGNLYVGFLTGFPFPVGGAWVEVLNPEGESLRRYEGLTMVTDIDLAADGTLYAVEFGQFGEQGPVLNAGRIVRATEGGVEPVVTGLNFPYGLEANADGSFYVTNNTSFVPSGELLLVQPGDNFAPPAPAATAEATTEPGGSATTEPGGSATTEPDTGEPGGSATMEATMEATSDATMEATLDPTLEVTVEPPLPTAEATTAP